MDVENLAKQLILKGMSEEQQKTILASIKTTMGNARAVQKQRIGENVQVVVQALRKIESDIKSRYDELGNKIETRVASIKDGQDGRDGVNGKDGRPGPDGRNGAAGATGPRGVDGVNGRDGENGVSVTDAHIDFDGSLVISLSSGRTINVGEVVAPDLAEKIKVITNGGGTSQQVLDTLASLQTQINTLIPSQTGNAGKFLTTDGTTTSWATTSSLPSQTGNSGYILTTNGTAASWTTAVPFLNITTLSSTSLQCLVGGSLSFDGGSNTAGILSMTSGSSFKIESGIVVGGTYIPTVFHLSGLEKARFDATGTFLSYQPAQTSKAAAATLTIAELKTGIIQYTGAAATLTVPTAANINGGFTGTSMAVDTAFEFSIINTGSGTATLGANGNTTVGALTVATATSGRFRVRKTAATPTFTIYRI